MLLNFFVQGQPHTAGAPTTEADQSALAAALDAATGIPPLDPTRRPTS